MPSLSRSISSSPNLIGKTTVGWIPESGGRGTLGLIITCTFTIFLCTWVVIHPRVTKRPLVRKLHKIVIFFKTIIAPEFIAVEGLQEWSQAQKMVRGCAGYTGGGLKLVHAYYIGMLALTYKTEKGERLIWPNQYQWLLQEGLVKWRIMLPGVCRKRTFRTRTSLMIKPKDITTASLMDLPIMSSEQLNTFESMAVSNLFDNEEKGKEENFGIIWALTPRVFEKEAQDKALKDAKEARQQAENKRTMVEQGSGGDEEAQKEAKEAEVALPEEIVVAHWDPDLYHSKILFSLSCISGASFGALHLISWNSQFPTLVELWLWRGSSIASIVTLLAFMHYEKVVLRWGGPLTIISILSPALYLLSRVIMIAEVIAAFRAMEPAVYETYVVSDYWISVF